jgi:hypothetical protein
MEKLIEELKGLVSLKDSTEVGDIVIIAAKEPQMLIYACITSIAADTSRKDEWWNVDFTFLSMPPQKMTWTLRTSQMTGMEIFTMGGEERFFKAVDLGLAVSPLENDKPSKNKKSFIKRVK